MSPSATSTRFLTPSRDGDSPTSLGSLVQCFKVHWVHGACFLCPTSPGAPLRSAVGHVFPGLPWAVYVLVAAFPAAPHQVQVQVSLGFPNPTPAKRNSSSIVPLGHLPLLPSPVHFLIVSSVSRSLSAPPHHPSTISSPAAFLPDLYIRLFSSQFPCMNFISILVTLKRGLKLQLHHICVHRTTLVQTLYS